MDPSGTVYMYLPAKHHKNYLTLSHSNTNFMKPVEKLARHISFTFSKLSDDTCIFDAKPMTISTAFIKNK